MATTKEQVSLYYREGSSDKVYQAELIEENKAFSVNFAYGRRGNTLTAGSKVQGTTYDQAKRVYDKLVREKKGKGYVEDPSAKPFAGYATVNTEGPSDDIGIKPQLLNDIEEEDVEKYLTDDNFCAQEKYDGRRRLLVREGDQAKGANRKGLVVAISDDITSEMLNILPGGNYVLDGEAVGEDVMVFDLLCTMTPYKERYKGLIKAMRNLNSSAHLKLAPIAWTTKDKRELYQKLKAENAEGIVFKNVNAPFTPGRPNSGGDQLKFKFYATASCIVSKVSDAKRSVSLSLLDELGKQIPVGNVTVYPNQQIPKEGSIVEVRYLYYFAGGSLFQPVLIGERDDIHMEDCVLSQLKLKREEIEHE